MVEVRCSKYHKWDVPNFGDDSLVCLRCFHRIPFRDRESVKAELEVLRSRFGDRMYEWFREELNSVIRRRRRSTG